MERKVRAGTSYPLQEPLRPAAQAIDSDPHLGEWSNVQDLHEEGVILLPLKPGCGEEGHEEGKLAVVRGPGRARNQTQGKEGTNFCSAQLSAPSDSSVVCLATQMCSKILS